MCNMLIRRELRAALSGAAAAAPRGQPGDRGRRMLDTLLRQSRPAPDSALTTALAEAAAAIARLDEALDNHPLRTAFLYRARLDAVRRQAAVDGKLIDPWHLAAVLQGLRLRVDGAMRIIDRGEILDAARHALTLYQWIVAPDFDEEGEVQEAERHLADVAAAGDTPLLAAARGVHAWLDSGGTRPPIRAALVRFWTRRSVLRVPVPLAGAAALRAETSFELSAWPPAFLRALATEAADGRQLLMDLERAWFAARSAVAGRRRDSHAAAAVDLLAATPLISATSLAACLGLAVKTAIRLLDSLVVAGVAVEVTHRSKRRLFGLKGMAPLGDAVRPPCRPEPGRGRGRPPILAVEDDVAAPPPPPLTPVERRAFDYSDLDHCMAHLDQTIRQTRRALQTLASPVIEPAPTDPQNGVAIPAMGASEPGRDDEHMDRDV
jgi:hypothetical protein